MINMIAPDNYGLIIKQWKDSLNVEKIGLFWIPSKSDPTKSFRFYKINQDDTNTIKKYVINSASGDISSSFGTSAISSFDNFIIVGGSLTDPSDSSKFMPAIVIADEVNTDS